KYILEKRIKNFCTELSFPNLSLFANLHSRTSSALNFYTVSPAPLLFSLSVFDSFLPHQCLVVCFAIASCVDSDFICRTRLVSSKWKLEL
ncbi:hypothetical protein VIGAN_06067200, partial [Vigna angularis var. angularis]